MLQQCYRKLLTHLCLPKRDSISSPGGHAVLRRLDIPSLFRCVADKQNKGLLLRQYAKRDIIKCMNTQEELIELKEKSGLSLKKLSDYFGIPYRTLQDWYYGNRKMPEYLLRLMIYKMEMEKLLNDKKEDAPE